jgi:hypothetical protein
MNILELVSDGFVAPSNKQELDGALGLTVHEIAKSLGSRFQEVRDAIEREWDNMLELQTVSVATLHPVNGQTVDSYVLSVPAAQFIVARFGNKIGAAYCKYLIQRAGVLDRMEQNISESPELALKFAEAVKNQALIAIELRKAVAIREHALKSLTTSQTNNAQITRENNQLKEKLLDLSQQVGDSINYKTVKAMTSKLPEEANLSVVGKNLARISKEMGYEIKKIEDTQYGKVNAYHVKVWATFLQADNKEGGN